MFLSSSVFVAGSRFIMCSFCDVCRSYSHQRSKKYVGFCSTFAIVPITHVSLPQQKSVLLSEVSLLILVLKYLLFATFILLDLYAVNLR